MEFEIKGKLTGFIDFFKKVPDHRVARHKQYSLEEISLLTFCGMIAGYDSWNDLELFGKTKLDYLRRYLPYKNEAPSDYTLRRFFRTLDPEKFESCFIKWVHSFQINIENKVIAVDGKISRRSFDGDNKPNNAAFVTGNEAHKGHGRLEVRECATTEDIAWLRKRHPK